MALLSILLNLSFHNTPFKQKINQEKGANVTLFFLFFFIEFMLFKNCVED